MYLDFLVEVPKVAGKITRKTKNGITYINYEYGREYDPERRFNIRRLSFRASDMKTREAVA